MTSFASKRRLKAWLALVALLFATAVTPLSHGFAMAAPAAMAMAGHDHHAHDAAGDEDAMLLAADSHDAMPMPCDQGCALCKNCALCSLQVVHGPSAVLLFFQASAYGPAPIVRSSSHIAALPSEPPRV